MSEEKATIDLEKIRKIFSADKFATEATNIVIDEVDVGFCKCSFKIAPKHINGAGGVMGGAIYTLADFAFAVASNWQKINTVTLSSQITYLGGAKGDSLIAECRCVKDGRSTCFYETSITDNLGTKIALVTSNGMKLNK